MGKERSNQKSLKLDQAVKVLFRLSERLTLQLINGLFGEQHDLEQEYSIHYSNTEFINEDFETLTADLNLRLETGRESFHYHVEFQTLNDQSMIIRMFQYGAYKAVELALGNKEPYAKNPPLVLTFPQQLVIFLEENQAIGEELSARLRLPDGMETTFRVPVLRYWTLTPKEMQRRQLYALLPLQVFRSRKRLNEIHARQLGKKEKQRLVALEFEKLKETIQQTFNALDELANQEPIPSEAMVRIIQIIKHILEHLYRKYGAEYKKMKREVMEMAKSFIDPKLIEQGREKGKREGKLEVARNLLKLSVTLDIIEQATGLTKEQVLEIKAEE